MDAGMAMNGQKPRSLIRRGVNLLLGAPLPDRVPERVVKAIQKEQDQSEVLVSVIQLIAIGMFGVLYALTPKGFGADVSFEPVPITLAVYAVFTLVRLWLALKHRLPRWFIATSIVVDVVVLLVTIWSFHLQYEAPPALYLKATTLMYVFILIALRTLRFEPVMVMLTGLTAALGWLIAVIYAVAHEQTCGSMELMEALAGANNCGFTHMFSEYTTSYKILLGAELDKIVSIVMVTTILAIALIRARKLLIRATTEHQAAEELSRFFSPEVAGRIRDTDAGIEPGDAELREAAIIMTDLRGFTPLATKLPPREVMALLSDYQSRVVAAISGEGGSIDKFMGDGILASFGATLPSDRPAAQALRAADVILEAGLAWQAERQAAGLPAPAVGLALTTGKVMFGAIGDANRLEYTVIGDPVNLVAKLEKHTKEEQVRGLCPASAYEKALAEGYRPGAEREQRYARRVEGVQAELDLMVLG